MEQLVGQDAARAMLLPENFHQADQLPRLLETREEVILLQLLVVVLDEAADDVRAIRHQARREVGPFGGEATQAFLVDEENAVQNSVLPHQVFRRSDVFFRLVPHLRLRARARQRESRARKANPVEKVAPVDGSLVHRHTSLITALSPQLWTAASADPLRDLSPQLA